MNIYIYTGCFGISVKKLHEMVPWVKTRKKCPEKVLNPVSLGDTAKQNCIFLV